jgi:hypothetical protein
VIIVVILAWPLIFKAIRRILPAKAAAVVDEVSHEPALAIAEHHPVVTSEAGLTEVGLPSDKEIRDLTGDRADPEEK